MVLRPLFVWMTIAALCMAQLSLAQPPALIRSPYLQVASDTGIHIRWRTDAPDKSRVQWGTSASGLTMAKEDEALVTDHEISLTGLAPSTKYWYSIGNPTTVLQGDGGNYFMTLPAAGSKGLIRVGVIGDCGNNSVNQVNVRDRLQAYLGTNYMNAWILLGDNAYSYGQDAEYQAGFFNIYQDRFLKQSPLFPAPGNHDYSDNPVLQNNHLTPYYSNFSMPTAGEAGGVPSNNKAYYSFNIGNAHFLSLDSYGQEDGATRLYDTTGRQVQWIKQDLEANQNKGWVIAYWHHPPFTMGSHNSDTEGELVNIRSNFIRILERYGVDVILCGHSHDYERSKLQKGHFGMENTFDPALHNLSTSSALYDGGTASCPYLKDTAGGNAGTVYVVSGSAGQLGGTTAGYPHDAMYYSDAANGGAMLLEIEDNRLDARWICADGVIRDRFTIMKNAGTKKLYSLNTGDSVTLTASFVGNYNWTPGGAATKAIKVSPAVTTTYFVSDPYNCLRDTFIVNVNIALPVSWGMVKGWYSTAERLVYINWQTVQEKDSHHFTVERSSDGITFIPAGTVAASGTTTAPTAYLFKDGGTSSSQKICYYRIRQVDNNGPVNYSPVITINLTGSPANFDVQVVPNPGHETDVKIRLVNGANTLPATIHIADVSGKTIAVKQLMLRPALQPFMPSVPTGIYFLTVRTGNGTSVIRVVIQ